MKELSKCLLCLCLLLLGTQVTYAQKACCATNRAASAACKAKGATAKACCATSKGAKETTSGCTPSNCRGAQTKFGEAKVISDLRLQLIALKAKMEQHEKLEFSPDAISVHDIIGETDEQSLDIVAEHVILIQSEIALLTKNELPVITWSEKKALKVKQLNDRMVSLTKVL